MDWTSVIVAAIALLGTFSGSVLGIRQANKVTELRISSLEKKMDKHNSLMERMAISERDIDNACRRLDSVEKIVYRKVPK